MKDKLLLSGKILVVLLSAFLLGACSKEGPQGPAGPQGEQGAAGSRGTKGDKGDKGDPGTANVIYSDWITKNQSDWSGVGTNVAVTTISAPDLTADIIDKGAFLCYVKIPTSGSVLAMPITVYDGSTIASYIFAIKTGQIEIDMSGSGAVSPQNSIKFRYVIIPGGTHARLSNPGPDLTDYHAVCRYYGIPE